MSVDFNYLIVGVFSIHTIVLAALALSVKGARDDRTRLLWKPLVLEVVLLPIAFSVLYYFQPPNSWLTTTADLVYSIVIAYVLGLEIPGFALLTRFDDGIVGALEDLRKDLVTLGYSFDHLGQLKATFGKSKEELEPANIGSLIRDFLISCDRMRNLDRNFWGLVLSEVSLSIRSFAERSKHPSPKLIEVMSLAGLSFLLAQFLKLFG